MVSSEELVIRRAVMEDAARLARLGAAIFADTFAASNTAADMESYLADNFDPRIQAAEMAEAGSSFLLAEVAGEPVGYARLKSGSPLPAGSSLTTSPAVEIVRFYVDRSWHGRGVAPALMQACLAAAGPDGALWLAVWEENPRAIAFYRKWGFVVVGEKIFQLGNDRQRDLVMVYCGA